MPDKVRAMQLTRVMTRCWVAWPRALACLSQLERVQRHGTLWAKHGLGEVLDGGRIGGR